MQALPFTIRHQQPWHALWLGLAGHPPAEGLMDELVTHYSQQHRHYHTLQHLDACLRHCAEQRALAQQPDEVALALWFHDAIYVIGAVDNERRSADWARAAVLDAGCATAVAERVHDLVMVTRHDQPPRTPDQQVVLDIDLAILGAPAAVFDAYEEQIGREYRSVPEPTRRANRARILQGFLDRPRIYHTDLFHDRREAQARDNLARSIRALAG